MWQLLITDEAGNEYPVPLPPEGCSIGRGPGNLIRLTDNNVSRHHARLRSDGDRLLLEDLDSQNGTFFNGERIQKPERLRPGGVFMIGDYTVRVTFAEPTHPEPFAPTLGAVGRLVVMSGPNAGAVLALPLARTVIGRGDDADIVLEGTELSRQHCEIVALDGELLIKDLASVNGTSVNGKLLKRRARVRLKHGDRIQLGAVELRFETREESEAPSPAGKQVPHKEARATEARGGRSAAPPGRVH